MKMTDSVAPVVSSEYNLQSISVEDVRSLEFKAQNTKKAAATITMPQSNSSWWETAVRAYKKEGTTLRLTPHNESGKKRSNGIEMSAAIT